MNGRDTEPLRLYLRRLRWALDWERDAWEVATGCGAGADPLGTLTDSAPEDYAELTAAAAQLRARLRVGAA